MENTVHQILGLMQAPEDRARGRVFYLADYEPIDVLEWAQQIQAETGGPAVKSWPIGILRTVAAAGDLLKRLGSREPPLTSFRLNNLITEMVYDLDPVRALVPDQPVSLDEGVERTVAWLQAAGGSDARATVPS